MAKKETTTPVAEAAAGVTTENTSTTAQTSANALNTTDEPNIWQLTKLAEIERERADTAEAKVEELTAALDALKEKALEADAHKFLYEAADGNTYELTQSQFRYKGELHKAEDVITNQDLLEELIAAKAFFLKIAE